MATWADIADAIRDLIYAKMSGATWDELTDRQLGDLKVTQSTTMEELFDAWEKANANASAEEGGAEIASVML